MYKNPDSKDFSGSPRTMAGGSDNSSAGYKERVPFDTRVSHSSLSFFHLRKTEDVGVYPGNGR